MLHKLIKVGVVALLEAIGAKSRAEALILSISCSTLGSILEAKSIEKSIIFWYHLLIDFLMVSGWMFTLFLKAFWHDKLSCNKKCEFLRNMVFPFVSARF